MLTVTGHNSTTIVPANYKQELVNLARPIYKYSKLSHFNRAASAITSSSYGSFGCKFIGTWVCFFFL